MADGEEWFAQDGPFSDVIVSTRVRLARNLADFCFPDRLSGDDRERVASLVKDSLKDVRQAGQSDFIIANTANMKESTLSFLEERSLRADESDCVAMLPSGDIGVLMNDRDHVRIVSFAAGLDVEKAVNKARDLESMMQEKLQFAANRSQGYLTSALQDSGSGMKISVRIHIPSIVYCGKADIFVKNLQAEGFNVASSYHDYDDDEIAPFEAIGCYYDVSTASSVEGNETDQMAKVVSQMKHTCDLERKFRKECADNNGTLVRDLVTRDCATMKVATFMDEREAEEIISTLKWGIDLGFLANIDYNRFTKLNYHVRDAHVDAALESGNYKFEEDIKDDSEMKRNRLRAAMMYKMFSCVTSK